MPKFGVYYIPEADDELYQLGSSVVGYDNRKQKCLQPPQELQDIPGFSDQWISKAKPYGFHLTVGDAIEFDANKLGMIATELAEIIGCFNPDNDFVLLKRDNDFITFWKSAVVLRYNPNDHLKVLHAVIAARMHPLGTGSGYLQRHLNNPEKEANRPYRVNRILKFYSPTIFDSYSPHFTLLNPYTGKNKRELADLFSFMFGRLGEVKLRSFCLVTQMSAEEKWHIQKEFKL